MSGVSITSRECNIVEARQELESLRALNNSLKLYLDQLRTYKQSLSTMNDNFSELKTVNEEWIKALNLHKAM